MVTVTVAVIRSSGGNMIKIVATMKIQLCTLMSSMSARYTEGAAGAISMATVVKSPNAAKS